MNSENCCKSYKLIFMDVEMPGENGMEGTKKLREV
jgi:CheY-like chemotaxis protein